MEEQQENTARDLWPHLLDKPIMPGSDALIKVSFQKRREKGFWFIFPVSNCMRKGGKCMIAVPDVKPGEHRRRSTAKHPHSEEDNEERGGEHHLASVGGCVSYRQGKGHGST